MSAGSGAGLAVIAALALVGGLAGCGLKGSLTMPEKTGSVVIRGGPTPTSTGPATTAPAPTVPATETRVPPEPDKLPPPDIPHSNSGASR